MEGQEYLNQLAATARPMKKSKASGLFSSKLFFFGIGALVLLIITIIIGVILGGSKGGEKNLSFALKLHMDNTASIVHTYQSSVKSSDLRSNSASLYSVLSDTSRRLTDYLTEKYKFKEKDIDKKISKDATDAMEALEAELFEAKINGILDRIYTHKMAYEISVIMSEEAKLISVSSNETLDELLTTSYNSLQTLYGKFNEFSETK